ncbi:MAG: hypothetical protein SFT93_04325 [Rickettsiaceae bacterium]|nr:hypothetical protein [Rickettsiaceae bacterium]
MFYTHAEYKLGEMNDPTEYLYQFLTKEFEDAANKNTNLGEPKEEEAFSARLHDHLDAETDIAKFTADQLGLAVDTKTNKLKRDESGKIQWQGLTDNERKSQQEVGEFYIHQLYENFKSNLQDYKDTHVNIKSKSRAAKLKTIGGHVRRIISTAIGVTVAAVGAGIIGTGLFASYALTAGFPLLAAIGYTLGHPLYEEAEKSMSNTYKKYNPIRRTLTEINKEFNNKDDIGSSYKTRAWNYQNTKKAVVQQTSLQK